MMAMTINVKSIGGSCCGGAMKRIFGDLGEKIQILFHSKPAKDRIRFRIIKSAGLELSNNVLVGSTEEYVIQRTFMEIKQLLGTDTVTYLEVVNVS